MLKLARAVAGLEEGREKLRTALCIPAGALRSLPNGWPPRAGNRGWWKTGVDYRAPRSSGRFLPGRGFVSGMATDLLGQVVADLGAGRKRKKDIIDPVVGLVFHKKPGDPVEPGEPLVEIHARTEEQAPTAGQVVLQAIKVTEEPLSQTVDLRVYCLTGVLPQRFLTGIDC